MDIKSLRADELRAALVEIALEWERRYSVAPAITSAISEYDAARLVGLSSESFALDGVGRTAVTRGSDFQFQGLRYQVKACRPSGKPGSKITKVPKANNYDWDLLIWLLYDRDFQVLEAWEWPTEAYKAAFDTVDRLSPPMMRAGRAVSLSTQRDWMRPIPAPPEPIATVAQYKQALLQLRDKNLPESHLTMLRAQCRAPESTITSTKLAEAAGFKNYNAANLQYGTLAFNLAAFLDYTPNRRADGTSMWWPVLSYSYSDHVAPDTGQFQFIMRPELVTAMREMRWA